MMPKGNVVQIRTWSKRASPRCVGQKITSPWARSRGAMCIIQARAEAMSRSQPLSAPTVRSSMWMLKTGTRRLRLVTA